jgi:hypothetical protein
MIFVVSLLLMLFMQRKKCIILVNQITMVKILSKPYNVGGKSLINPYKWTSITFLEMTMVVTTHKDDVWAFWLDNMCHMCEHNFQQIFVNEATKMIVSLVSWSWQCQSI